MDTSNRRPNQGGSANGGDSSMGSGDWRSQLQADARQRIVNKIMDTLKRHLPFSGAEGLQELNRIAVRFEEKIYSAATSQSDYLRKITLKMLSMETRSENPMSYSTLNGVNPSGPGSNSSNWRPSQGGSGESFMQFYDWRSQLQPDSRQRIVNKITDTLKRHLPYSGHEGLEELNAIAARYEEKIYAAATSQVCCSVDLLIFLGAKSFDFYGLQTDYLRIISLKLLSFETKPQNPMPNAMQSYPTANSLNSSDPGISNTLSFNVF
ncbi:hypothetical protein OSB04_029960 [Centaurea solstitialis]|uniref:Mediator complex subunit 15 KIX domain-containing protein n=1 Tax=Centaurea solstitialis TaxID=347529 RepID=A0AA38VW90_9ASTR|nr:hypothetical protein OSB04_029960 [Centaurea solstitialis]